MLSGFRCCLDQVRLFMRVYAGVWGVCGSPCAMCVLQSLANEQLVSEAHAQSGFRCCLDKVLVRVCACVVVYRSPWWSFDLCAQVQLRTVR